MPQVDDDAPPEEIKRASRASCKECHPDFLGDVGHNICIMLNEVRGNATARGGVGWRVVVCVFFGGGRAAATLRACVCSNPESPEARAGTRCRLARPHNTCVHRIHALTLGAPSSPP